MSLRVCPICGEFVSVENSVHGDWVVCASHTVFVKKLQYDQRCEYCVKHINKGTKVLMCHYKNRWVVLHFSQKFCSAKRQEQKKYENDWYNEFRKNERHYTRGLKNNLDNPYQKLYITRNAPFEVIKAAYKALALLHHPDVGGNKKKNEEKMKEINTAFDEIMKRRDK